MEWNADVPCSSFIFNFGKKVNNLGMLGDSLITNFQTNAERMNHTLNLMTKFNMLPSNLMVKIDKNEATALSEKIEGNKYFGEKNYVKALEHYNRSLCFTPDNSENLSIVYANRSAIYLNTGYYDACMENIQLALQHGYPERLKPKLLKRKEECLVLMNNKCNDKKKEKRFEDSETKLSYKANPKLSCIVDCIKLVINEKYGRHLVTTKDLNPGDILIIDDPYCPTLQKSVVYFYCLFCLECNLMNLKPCSESTTAMFCSKKCYDKSMDQFFKYEGPIQSLVYHFFGPDSGILQGIRTLLKLFCMFKNPDDLKVFLDQVPLEKLSAFDIDYNNASEKDLFRLIYAFKTVNMRKESIVIYALLYHILMTYTDLKKLIKTKAHEDWLMEVLCHFFNVHRMNLHRMCGTIPNLEWDNAIGAKGFALYPVCSLLNHSCAPNVRRAGENQSIVVAMRSIKAGEQLFDCYGPAYWKDTRNARQQSLVLDYNFICQCIACKKNYPLYVDSSFCSPKIASLMVDVEKTGEYQWKDLELAKSTLKKVNQMLKNNCADMTTNEYYLLSEAQQAIFLIITSKPPLRLLLEQ